MLYTSAGTGYQVDGTERLVLTGQLDQVLTFSSKELAYLFFILWLVATGRMQS